MATTTQIVSALQNCDPNKLEGTVHEAIEKTCQKGNILIANIASGINPVGSNDFDRFCRLIAALEKFVGSSSGHNKPATTPTPVIAQGGIQATPVSTFDEKQLDDEIVQWCQDASTLRKLKTYKLLNIQGLRMTSIDYEIAQEVNSLKAAAKQQP